MQAKRYFIINRPVIFGHYLLSLIIVCKIYCLGNSKNVTNNFKIRNKLVLNLIIMIFCNIIPKLLKNFIIENKLLVVILQSILAIKYLIYTKLKPR